MGFFKDIQDELEQAVNDIDVNQTEEEDDLFALFSESDDVEVDQDLLDNVLEEEAEEKEAEAVTEQAPEETPEVSYEEADTASTEVNATSVITKGTTINGSISAECSLEVMGTVNGDIECLGKLTISGKVTGNAIASEVEVTTNRLEGSIVSEGKVNISRGTVVIGDVSATSAVFAGAVKGEIDVKGPVILESTAVVKGNIKAQSIQMNNGAILEGFCSLAYADVKIDDFFN